MPKSLSWGLFFRLAYKTAALFILANLLIGLLNPLDWLGGWSVHQGLVAGRPRLPFSRDPASDYSTGAADLDWLLATHELSRRPTPSGEYRMLLLGDSSVWGWGLSAEETLSACLNRGGYRLPDGRRVRAYNLGYPALNISKDGLILAAGLQFAPDVVILFTTLAALYPQSQFEQAIVPANLDHPVLQELDSDFFPPAQQNWQDRTLLAGRGEWRAWLDLQVYGLAWHFTRIDHRPARAFEAVRTNLVRNEAIPEMGRELQTWGEGELLWPWLEWMAAQTEAAGAAFWLVNQPIYRSTGANSDMRYNSYYPRQAYDHYRALLSDRAALGGWVYIDLWESLPNEVFTDSSFHYTPAAACDLAAQLIPQAWP